MANKKNGWVVLSNGTRKPLKASGPKQALAAARELLKLPSLTRRTLDKAKVISIHFGSDVESRIIYPTKGKRTIRELRNSQCVHDRPACVCKHQNDVSNRKYNGFRIAV